MSEQEKDTTEGQDTAEGATPNDVASVASKGTSQDQAPPKDVDRQGEPDDEVLGEPGKRALAAEREYREAAEREAREFKQEVERLRPQIEGIPKVVADHLRSHLIAVHGISDEDSELFLTSENPDVLLKQVARLTSRADLTAPTTPKPDLSQGGSAGTPRPQTAAEKFAAAFEGRV